MDVDKLPGCCRAKLQEIERILDSCNALEIVLSIAPDLVVPRPAGIRSIWSALWNIAKAGVHFVTIRKELHGTLQVIARNRVRTVIDLHIVEHSRDGNVELEQHWTRMREAFAP
jgi:hypothetical protein